MIGVVMMKNRLFYKRESYIVILTLVLWVVISFINTNFALPSYILELIGFNNVFFICSMGILPLMIKGDFDLSVGGIITTVSLMLTVIVAYIDLPIVVLLPLAGSIGALFGYLNGYIIGKLKVSSVIVTLAMMNIHYGLSKYVHRVFAIESLSSSSYDIEKYVVSGVPLEIILIILVVLVTFYMIKFRSVGRSAMAFGGDRALAIRKGLDEFRTTVNLHSYSGLMAGIAAGLYILTFNQPSIDVYSGIEFELIIIVVIGGLNILGGYGSVHGTLAAAIFIVILKSGMVFARIPVFWHDMMIGMIIVLVISYDMAKHRDNLKRFKMRGGHR